MSRHVWIGLCVALAIGALTLPGCGRATNYNKTQYVLDPSRPGGPLAAAQDAVLEVRRFTIDSAFSDKGLVYRSTDLQYEADFYHEFLVSPVAMIREATRNWFTQSGLFARVADPGSYVEPTVALEANVTALYGDLRDENNPQAVVELRVFLLKIQGTRDPVVVHSETYSATDPLQTHDPDGLVSAFNRCLQTILIDLEADLAAKL